MEGLEPGAGPGKNKASYLDPISDTALGLANPWERPGQAFEHVTPHSPHSKSLFPQYLLDYSSGDSCVPPASPIPVPCSLHQLSHPSSLHKVFPKSTVLNSDFSG